jgi:membrane-anchored glycerophosphoryl diester phosphodiesterase (GDPDase)
MPPPYGAGSTSSSQVGPPAGPPPGWTPPPKPGLIPLRPLDLGTILGGSFRVLRRNPKPTFGAALLIQGASSVLVLVVLGLVTYLSLSRIDFAAADDSAVIQAGSVAAIVATSLAAVLFTIATSALLQGIIVLEVSRATLGEKLTLRQLWRLAHGRLWALIGWSLLVAAGIAFAVVVLVGAIVLVVATLGNVGVAIAVLIGILGGFALLAVAIWIGTKLTLVSSALMIERLSLRAAIARSWRLTTGAFWRTFGIQLLVSVIINVALQVISAPLSLLSPLLLVLLDPNGQNQSSTIGVSIGITVLAAAVTLVFGAIGAVVQAATSALIYVDRRIRTEGLDLELARVVEARQAGERDVADPYLPGAQNLRRPVGPIPPTDASPWA